MMQPQRVSIIAAYAKALAMAGKDKVPPGTDAD